jgi:hypothetical protein
MAMSVECISREILPNGDAKVSLYDSQTGDQWDEVIVGYMDDEPDTTPLFRVTYFSFFHRPIHHVNLTLAGKDQMVFQGRQEQKKVVVTLMTEDEPDTF